MSQQYPQCNAAKLTLTQVQNVRDLHRAGFTYRCIADCFNVCQRTVCNIVKGRHWYFVPDVPLPLPIFPEPIAVKLRTRRGQLSRAQQEQLNQYRHQLALHHDATAEREGYALRLAGSWAPKRLTRRRRIHRTVEVAA